MADDDRESGGRNGEVRRLVIVESPTKARKIAGYLGKNYVVESSRGHIRDLPRAAADVPAGSVLPAPVNLATMAGKACPECGNHTLIHKDGCEFCTACGYVGQCG